jgi:hypothetical protein
MKYSVKIIIIFGVMMNLLESHPGRTDEHGGHEEGMLGKYHIHHNNDPIFTSESKLRKLEDFKSVGLKVWEENFGGYIENHGVDCEFSYKYRISDKKFICTIKITRKDKSVNVYDFFTQGKYHINLSLEFKDKDNIPVRKYGLHTKYLNGKNIEGFTVDVISEYKDPNTIEYLFTFGYDLVSYIGIEEIKPRISYGGYGTFVFEQLNTNK